MSLSPWLAVDVDTVPSKRARELRDAWEDFVEDRLQGDDEDPGTPDVRGPIADSWHRSREAGVDPTGRLPAKSVVELDGARALWDDHPRHSASALPGERLGHTSRAVCGSPVLRTKNPSRVWAAESFAGSRRVAIRPSPS